MRKGLKAFLILTFLILCNFSFSQTLSITQIDSLIAVLDTTAYKQKTVEGTVTTKPIKDKGGSTAIFYLDTLSKSLMKVEVAQALYDKSKHLTNVELSTYYYHNHKLIMVKSCRFDTFGYPSFKKALSSGTYYYNDEKIILSREIGYKHGGITYISRAKTYRDVLLKKVFPADL